MKLKIGRYNITITHEDKNLFGKSYITKKNLINYYISITPLIMPHLKNRLISMQRFPQGIDEEGFFQKNAGDYFPNFVTQISVPKQNNEITHYVTIDKPATLIYLANQNCITPHTWLSKIDKLEKPDRMIFDLDPGENVTFKEVQQTAKKLKIKLDSLSIPSFCMLTGSRGVHIVVPLKRIHTFDETREFSHTIALELTQKFPSLITTAIQKSERNNHVFIDWLRNGFGSTGVAPYAVRAHAKAPIAMPITWQELIKPTMHSQRYTINNAIDRVDTTGDIWHCLPRYAISLKRKFFMFLFITIFTFCLSYTTNAMEEITPKKLDNNSPFTHVQQKNNKGNTPAMLALLGDIDYKLIQTLFSNKSINPELYNYRTQSINSILKNTIQCPKIAALKILLEKINIEKGLCICTHEYDHK